MVSGPFLLMLVEACRQKWQAQSSKKGAENLGA
jgi:hypothetical protein